MPNEEELAESLGVTQQAISKSLKVMGMIQKQGNWVPYELKPRYIKQRFFACEQLLQRQNRKGFLHHIVTGDEKYYELLKPSETITEDRYRTQLMRFSKALKEKRPQYQERHDKVILQHENTRPSHRDGIGQLPERWKKVVASNGQYFES